ncbi:rhodanese-like domain-containing protein [Methylotuvimicrobium alcaliphilum]|uniref:Rhodanese domain protein n=1 Tax=Methylotuvimicrobium alcaliphilum (strain DSM 19304 / NCIMB 14124 / VKM B-2133 / 20Z) TaxID=1091494 RepID=G4STU8_META2|nr:rhodanese-like domain-containing protein [Methylotuvimicrobium alcaliphilum]CCE21775.1 Rhodanese domain protein [Methylotuvimicrobium alcaliphilum 20Z]
MVENLEPKQAWQLLQTDPSAVLIDVRTKMEHSYVGHPIGAVHIPWKENPDWQVNPAFVEQVAEAVPDKNAPVLLLCRSGQRSLDAAAALAAAGYSRPINILEGFEGPLDDDKHRGNRGGWRFHDLPWEQS